VQIEREHCTLRALLRERVDIGISARSAGLFPRIAPTAASLRRRGITSRESRAL